jgi:hypothetical protein
MSGQLLTLAAFTPAKFPLFTRQIGCWVGAIAVFVYIVPGLLVRFEQDIR